MSKEFLLKAGVIGGGALLVYTWLKGGPLGSITDMLDAILKAPEEIIHGVEGLEDYVSKGVGTIVNIGGHKLPNLFGVHTLPKPSVPLF